MANFMTAQVLVGFVHVADDDRDMLKPVIVVAPIDRDRPAFGREILREFNQFITKLHPHDAHAQTKNALQFLVFRAMYLYVADFLEP
jgi:hypothetical protein